MTLHRKAVASRSLLLLAILPVSLCAQDAAKSQVVQTEKTSQPSCRYCPNPDFPAEARKSGISSARVLVDAIITEKGEADPGSIRVLKDPGSGFANEAVKAVTKWKFKPATKGGKPVSSTRIPIEITFRIPD
ncbi:MAG TPA: energy transducer TonB [Candidatus Acidoferrum sp.]